MDIRDFEDKRSSQEPGSDINRNIREKGNRLASSGKDAAVQELSRIGTAIHKAAEKLYEQDDYFAGWADKAAERLDSLTNYLKEKKSDDIMHDLQDFSRRNPYVTVGVMFAAGLALSRVLKSGQR
ncbi:MAG: hypothetical protein GX089_09640 [Fibrobacter sp.]|jgi:ElaB/YqjD/DUF883 family membrane-anchored ribosome-binding protein|nr:hypothetical protein [Fibrobacter sp.]